VKLDIAEFAEHSGKIFFLISLAVLLLALPYRMCSAEAVSHPWVLWK